MYGFFLIEVKEYQYEQKFSRGKCRNHHIYKKRYRIKLGHVHLTITAKVFSNINSNGYKNVKCIGNYDDLFCKLEKKTNLI